jgi:dTMP kinase
MVASGGVNVSEVVLAERTLDAGAFGYGLMWAAAGVGLVVGGSLFAAAARRSIGRVYPASIALFAAAIGVAAIAPSIWIAAGAMVCSGIGNGVATVANITLVQRGAPDRLRGRAFTLIIGTNFAVVGLSMFAAGPLTDAVGARWVWGGCSAVLLLAAAIAAALARGLRLDEHVHEVVDPRPHAVEAVSH